MTHESEDRGFQEARAVAEYLEAHPCDRPECGEKKTCPMCINYAVEVVGYEMETERRAAEVERQAIDAEMVELAESFALEMSK